MSSALEKHHTLADVARAWNIGYTTVWRRFHDEPGLLRTGGVIRVPESKLAEMYERLTAAPARRVLRRQRQRRERAA